MAEKKKSMGFDEIMRNLKAGNFSPIYILMGNEAYYIDKIADYIAEMRWHQKSATSIKRLFLVPTPRQRKLWIWQKDIR